MSNYIDDKSCTSSAEFAVLLAPIAKRIVLCDMRPSKLVSEDGKVTEVKGELVPKCYGGQGAENQMKFDIFAASSTITRSQPSPINELGCSADLPCIDEPQSNVKICSFLLY